MMIPLGAQLAWMIYRSTKNLLPNHESVAKVTKTTSLKGQVTAAADSKYAVFQDYDEQ
ncbi:hypothetical protein [Bdellovibrio bacteriovorus]|uniref:hypothetical protein n=1 Tax=Bdellovibrio bacteriovorus TaxID=959 RepID=UPI0012DAB25F|nr:hypothetical protein [Bdellovibrio bacteriovorus]